MAGIRLLIAARHRPANISEQARQTTVSLLRLHPQASPIHRSDSTHLPYRPRCLPFRFAQASRHLVSANGPRSAGLRFHHPPLCLAILPVSYDTSIAEALP